MLIRPYLTFQGTCEVAIRLYERAFGAKIIDLMRFSDLPPNPDFPIPEAYQNQILQCRLTLGSDYIRLSDCGPMGELNDPESERISLALEATVEEIKHAFSVLSEQGRIGMPLEETFYSPCAGVVFDQFGVMWNLFAPPTA